MPPVVQSRSIVFSDIREIYTFGPEIGQGCFATVNKCYHKENGKEFAVKIIAKKKYTDTTSIDNEIALLKASKHPNVIKLYEVYEDDDNLYLVMELVNGGDLHSDINENGAKSEYNTFKIFSQLLEAVSYLHSINIVHRDIKLENILLPERSGIKLSDFGLSKKLHPSDTECMKTMCGTPAYVAPEMLFGDSYGPSVDVWSLGVILYTIICGEYPFKSTKSGTIFESIISGVVTFPSPIDTQLEELIRAILVVDVDKRISLEGIESHPWMKKMKSLNEDETTCPPDSHIPL